MPDDWLRSKAVDQNTAVIALCHDPRIDDMALMEALPANAFYVGAMGSERTSAKRRDPPARPRPHAGDLNRLHAPVGLDLGSKTPPEIAIAILAELTQLRAAVRDAQGMSRRAAGIGCIVLAAGSGTRFGSDKRQATFGADTLLAHTLGNIAAGIQASACWFCAPAMKLFGRRSQQTGRLFSRLMPNTDMGHSLAAAMSAHRGWDGAVSRARRHALRAPDLLRRAQRG